MLQKTLRTVCALALAFWVICAPVATALAVDTDVDFSKQGSIAITLWEGAGSHKVVPGASFRIYQIADIASKAGNLRYVLTPDFQDSGVQLDNLHADGVADHLAAYAQQNNRNASVGSADKTSGSVVFSNLGLGLYLVIQEGRISGYYPVEPFLVSLPMINADGTGWIYDIDASPKVEIKYSPSSSSDTELTVEKLWEDDGKTRPDSIVVTLLRDGEAFAAVTLNRANHWKHTWTGLNRSYRWSVSEKDVPEGYSVRYEAKGKYTVITNTRQDISDNPQSLTVQKIWVGDDGKARPAEITVELWNGDIRYASVALSEKNKWTHTWSELPESTQWRVREVDIPSEYEVSYSCKETNIMIKNTFNEKNPDGPTPDGEPPTPTPPTPTPPTPTPSTPMPPTPPSTLIQTGGRFNWAIPVLVVSGLALFAVGWTLVFGKRKRDDEA